jgi:glycerate-2-kinase
MPSDHARRTLEEVYAAALAAVDPEELVRNFARSHRRLLSAAGRKGLFAAGKAAVGMARGAAGLGFDGGLVVVPRGSSRAAGRPAGETLFAAHPEPDRSSLQAGKRALAFFESFGKGDLILALISGGASSLLCLPRAGLTLAQKRARIRRAAKQGWPIERLNRLRASLSRLKGGRLAESTQARVLTLVLSDIPGGNFRIVGSGPTISRKKRTDRAILLADNRSGLAAAAREARKRGLAAVVWPELLRGEASAAGRSFATRLKLFNGAGILMAGGETTVKLTGRSGRGGRSQEFALGACLELSGSQGLTLLAAGSDGLDGNSGLAGAFVDGETLSRALKAGLLPDVVLARHDSAVFFEKLGDAFVPGATGTNVADWVFGLKCR